VKDTGQGMNAETRQHLFEPFFTTKSPGKGTGLGLPSVYGGVQQNHGHIFVESEVDRGTTFSIYLPRVERPNLVDSLSPAAAGQVRGGETIIVVEDQGAVRRMLFEALTKSGYRVWEAANGVDAIRKYEDCLNEVDLLVTDVVMPVMGGLRLAEDFRGRRPNLPVLFTSGYAEDALGSQEALNPEMDLLQKPFTPHVLIDRVRAALDRAAERRKGSEDRRCS